MRKLVSCILLWGVALSAIAQSSPSTPAPKGWVRVEALQPNSTIYIKARTHNATCKLKSVDTDSLTCLSRGNEQTFQRNDIKSIKISHRVQSAVAGLAIGAGVGVIIGASSGGRDNLFTRGELAGIFAIPFAVIGAIVGVLTDFTHSTIYRG
jgi:hypothetical protein